MKTENEPHMDSFFVTIMFDYRFANNTIYGSIFSHTAESQIAASIRS